MTSNNENVDVTLTITNNNSLKKITIEYYILIRSVLILAQYFGTDAMFSCIYVKFQPINCTYSLRIHHFFLFLMRSQGEETKKFYIATLSMYIVDVAKTCKNAKKKKNWLHPWLVMDVLNKWFVQNKHVNATVKAYVLFVVTGTKKHVVIFFVGNWNFTFLNWQQKRTY